MNISPGKISRLSLVFGVLIMSIIMLSCNQKQKQKESWKKQNEIPLKYANGFKIIENDNYKQIIIYDPDNTDDIISRLKIFPKSYKGKLKEREIKAPVEKIICLSSTQLAYFIELNTINHIVALNSSKYLFNEKVNNKIDNGSIKRVGKEGNFNVELIAGIDPDLILVSPFKTGGYDALKNLGIPLLPIASYNEKRPLGRAEWIKLIGHLTGKKRYADSVFQSIDSTYNHYLSLVSDVEHRPTVFSGRFTSGSWYVPGGKSFIANLIHDAGADYIFDNNKKGGSPLDFEAVYSKGHDADFWRLQVSQPPGFTMEKFKKEDARYADFKAFKDTNIIFCNIRVKPYYEENPVKPHILLGDFIHHFHPDLLKDYNPRYYELLK